MMFVKENKKAAPQLVELHKGDNIKMSNKKRYYIPGVDTINQMVETPASKERTDKKRFVWNTIISAISAVAAVAAAIASFIALKC